jgi:hypothetical protein
MGQVYLDRYKRFKDDSNYKPLPGIKIPVKDSDKVITYKLGSTRFDRLSLTYYDTPYYGWLIMIANPEYGGLEFNIPDDAVIRIPFPFKASVNDYLSGIDEYIKLYG